MTASLFDSAWLKYGWAFQHAQALQADIADHARGDPVVTIRSEYHPKLHCFVLSVETMAPIPVTWGLRLGDFIQCQRSCLDHLAWALVARGRTPNLSVKAAKKVYFPYSRTPAQFHGELPVKLPGVRRQDIAIVRRYQPYRAGQRNLGRHCLAVLAALSNDDKHRQIKPVRALPRRAIHHVEYTDCVPRRNPVTVQRTVLDVGAEFSRIYVRRTGPNPRVDVKGKITTQPAIHEDLGLEALLNETNRTIFSLLGEFAEMPQEFYELGITGLASVWPRVGP